MSDTTINRRIVGFSPNDFVEGAGLPKRLHGPVKFRYCPWPLKRGGEKYGFFCVGRIEDEETETTHDVPYRIGWLPKVFKDKNTGENRPSGTMPTNDGPEVKDSDREPTASEAFFSGLGEGTKSVPEGTDIFEEYGGEYAMGDFPSKKEQFHELVHSLQQMGFDFPSPSLASLDDYVMTLESTVTGKYTDKDGNERNRNTHLCTELIAPTKKASSKKKAAPVEEEEEEAEAPKPKKTAKVVEPEEDDDDEDADAMPPAVQALESIIISILKATVTKTMAEGQVMIAINKNEDFQAFSKKDSKVALAAYNDRSLFAKSTVLVWDDDEDEISYVKPAKKG